MSRGQTEAHMRRLSSLTNEGVAGGADGAEGANRDDYKAHAVRKDTVIMSMRVGGDMAVCGQAYAVSVTDG